MVVSECVISSCEIPVFKIYRMQYKGANFEFIKVLDMSFLKKSLRTPEKEAAYNAFDGCFLEKHFGFWGLNLAELSRGFCITFGRIFKKRFCKDLRRSVFFSMWLSECLGYRKNTEVDGVSVSDLKSSSIDKIVSDSRMSEVEFKGIIDDMASLAVIGFSLSFFRSGRCGGYNRGFADSEDIFPLIEKNKLHHNSDIRYFDWTGGIRTFLGSKRQMEMTFYPGLTKEKLIASAKNLQIFYKDDKYIDFVCDPEKTIPELEAKEKKAW